MRSAECNDWRLCMEAGMKNEEFGFTLIEVIIALAVFSIGILGIIGMLIIGEQGITGGSKSFTAVQTAKAQMELLRGTLQQAAGSGVCPTQYTYNIQCEWSIKKDTPVKDLSTMEVTAAWYEGEKKRELVLTTLRFDGNE